MRFTLNLLCCLALTGCATYGGPALQPGQSTTTHIEQRLGPPALRWSEASGGETLVYPTGPMGYHTWFFRTNAEHVLIERKNVLNSAHFAKIQAGMSEEEVLDKFYRNIEFSQTLSRADADRVVGIVSRLEELDDIGELIAFMR